VHQRREKEEKVVKGEGVRIALTSFQFAVACTFACLLTVVVELSARSLRCTFPGTSAGGGHLVVELFIRFCRVLHFLNLQFLVASLCRLHAAVPCAFIYSLRFLYLYFIF